MEVLPREKLGCFMQVNGGEKFINNDLKLYCWERNIKIRYVVLYMHKENVMVKRCWRTLVSMKDALLINSTFPVYFWTETMDISNYLGNKLFMKCSRRIPIPEKAWTGNK